MDKPENPPAFPTATHHDMAVVQEGMTLRDWFAGQALAGMLANNGGTDAWTKDARLAYEAADAMLTARREAKQ